MAAPIVQPPRSTEIWERDTLEDIDEFEDTQPSVFLPDADDEFGDAPTLPGFRLRSDGAVAFDERADELMADDGQWQRALRAIAVAVKRVLATHSIS